MFRKIIKIDENKCNGCGLCVNACHEGAIELIDGKAKLTREDYCDGLGDCLPSCPMNAISFEWKEALAYNEAAVLAAQQAKKQKDCSSSCQQGCPSSNTRAFTPTISENNEYKAINQLKNWPIQIKLAPVNANFFHQAQLLVAADCCAYAYANFHQDFMKNKVTLIGCPKLDGIHYTDKLCEIIKNNDIVSLTIVRMEVPCCGGLEQACKNALLASGKFIPWQIVTISCDGKKLD